MRLMRVGTLLALAFFGVTGGPGPAWAISDAQRATGWFSVKVKKSIVNCAGFT